MSLNLFRKLFTTAVAMIIFSSFSVTAQALDSAPQSNTQVDTLSVEQAVVEQITAKINKLKLAVTSVTPAARRSSSGTTIGKRRSRSGSRSTRSRPPR